MCDFRTVTGGFFLFSQNLWHFDCFGNVSFFLYFDSEELIEVTAAEGSLFQLAEVLRKHLPK